MDRLTADAEFVGNGLPGPTPITGIRDLNLLEPLQQAAQGTHGAQAHCGIGTRGGSGEGGDFSHVVNIG